MAIEVAASRRLFTREEYYRMGEVGILKRSDHVELIKGEIVTMSPMGYGTGHSSSICIVCWPCVWTNVLPYGSSCRSF